MFRGFRISRYRGSTSSSSGTAIFTSSLIFWPPGPARTKPRLSLEPALNQHEVNRSHDGEREEPDEGGGESKQQHLGPQHDQGGALRGDPEYFPDPHDEQEDERGVGDQPPEHGNHAEPARAQRQPKNF